MFKPFSYLAVLSLVARRVASLDGKPDEMNGLIAHLLGVHTIADPISPQQMEMARERLFKQFPNLYPTGPSMVMQYGMMIECLEVVSPHNVHPFMIGWASQTKDKLGLPNMFDVQSMP